MSDAVEAEDKSQQVLDKFRSFIDEISDQSACDESGEGSSMKDVSLENLDDVAALLKSRIRAGLISRIKTYQSLIWTLKPKELTPLFCSLKGWICKEADLLCCVSCEKTVCVKLPSSDSDTYDHFVTKALETLTSNHHNLCPWKYNPATEDCYSMSFDKPEEDIQQLLTCAESLAAFTSGLQVSFTMPCVRRLRSLTALAAAKSEPLSSLSPQARERCLLLALAGWSRPPDGDFSPRNPVLTCGFCQRKVGLWNLNKSPLEEPEEEEEGAEDEESREPPQMPAPGFALTQMLVNRQLLFSKSNTSASDWSIISNAGSESVRDLDDAQSLAGSVASNVDSEPTACFAIGGGDAQDSLRLPDPPEGTKSEDPDQWSVMTNASSEKRDLEDPTTPQLSAEKRPRLEGSPTSSGCEVQDPTGLHWQWCPWRCGVYSAEWASSCLRHPEAPGPEDSPPSDGDSEPPGSYTDAYRRVARLMKDI